MKQRCKANIGNLSCHNFLITLAARLLFIFTLSWLTKIMEKRFAVLDFYALSGICVREKFKIGQHLLTNLIKIAVT